MLTLRAGDAARARELAAEAMHEVEPTRGRRPEQGHVRAMVLSGAALLKLSEGEDEGEDEGEGEGERETAEALLIEAYPVALATRDMPLVATIGVVVAALAVQRERPVPAAEFLGAAARLRGAEDLTHPEVARLTAELREELGDAGFTAAFERGRALDRDDALRRLDPQALT
jgi:hypothetical protein